MRLNKVPPFHMKYKGYGTKYTSGYKHVQQE